MINPVHLRTLTVVLRTGSFAVAARTLGYTPSAVSQQMAALERAVRLPLFEREARSVRPTPAAAFLTGRAHEVLAVLDALHEDVRGLSGGTQGTVRLGSFPTASQHLLPAALVVLAATHPEVTVHLDEGEPGELAPRVGDGDLDLALVYGYSSVPVRQPASVTSTALLREDLVLLVPTARPGEARAAGPAEGAHRPATASLRDLRDEVWVATRAGTGGATCLERMCASVGFEPDVAYRSNDYDVVHALVRAGLGIALVPRLALVRCPGVTEVGLADVVVHRQVGIVTRSDTSNPALDGVVQALSRSALALHDPAEGLLAESVATSG